MNKAYIIFPLIMLLIFGGFYWNFAKDYQIKQDAKVAAQKKAVEDKKKAELDARKQAIEDATRMAEQRIREKKEKEEKDQREKEARAAAIEAREKAARDQEKLSRQVVRLTKDIEEEKTAIAQVEEIKAKSVDEVAFLKTAVKESEANVKGLETVLTKIKAADDARAAAEALAAAAAAKSKN